MRPYTQLPIIYKLSLSPKRYTSLFCSFGYQKAPTLIPYVATTCSDKFDIAICKDIVIVSLSLLLGCFSIRVAILMHTCTLSH